MCKKRTNYAFVLYNLFNIPKLYASFTDNLVINSCSVRKKKMSSTPASATIDPHSALLAQRKMECDEYMRTLTSPNDPGEEV